MTPVLAFDIETVPDIEGLRRLHGLDATIPDKEVAEMAFQLRRQATGSDFLAPHLHRVVAISCALRERDSFKVWSLGGADDAEGELIQRFFDGLDKYTPQLVSWNGSGFDLPVLNYRGALHGVRAARYWEWGDEDRDFRYNNYVNRYHTRHLDLMDVLGMFQPRNSVALDDIAQLMGFPGKLGLDGSRVWETYLAGGLADIRRYCEADVVNTYLVFLRFQQMRGVLSAEKAQAERDLVRSTLKKSAEPHWKEFLGRWRG
jgi:predicted PolB exonuclease-like 3'-5' exonuclease